MKLHAGSLYKNTLILYGENTTPHIIFFEDAGGEQTLQFEIYCNDVEFSVVDSKWATVEYNGVKYNFQYVISNDPMKFLGFSQ